MTNVLLVDQHALSRESLARLLEVNSDIRVTAQCGTAEEALQLIEGQRFELLLLDHDLRDRGVDEVVSGARLRVFTGKIVIVAAGLTLAEALSMMSIGVSGVFLKANSPDLLIEAIRAVMRGETWMDPKYASREQETPTAEFARRARFTDRDRRVFRGVFDGLANKAIADCLQVSESAIKASLQQLFSKTGVRTRSQLVRVALENYRQELL